MELSTLPFRDKELLQEIEAVAQLMKVPKNQEILRQGQFIKVIPIVISGAVNVYRRDEWGKEIFLYTIEPSQTCAMTLQCCQTNEPSQIFAETILESQLLTFSVDYLEKWIEKHQEWKEFVYRSYQLRFQELIHTIDGIAFQKLDARLFDYLKSNSKATANNSIEITHQKIANDLSTSREVVSRLLKKMEKEGLLKLYRNRIELM